MSEPRCTCPWAYTGQSRHEAGCPASEPASERPETERLYIDVRAFLDYPSSDDRTKYLRAVEALDELAALAAARGDTQ